MKDKYDYVKKYIEMHLTMEGGHLLLDLYNNLTCDNATTSLEDADYIIWHQYDYF